MNLASISVDLVLPGWALKRILARQLRTYSRFATCRVGALIDGNFEVLATGRRPHADVGRLVVTGDADDPVVARVVDIVDRPGGRTVLMALVSDAHELAVDSRQSRAVSGGRADPPFQGRRARPPGGGRSDMPYPGGSDEPANGGPVMHNDGSVATLFRTRPHTIKGADPGAASTR